MNIDTDDADDTSYSNHPGKSFSMRKTRQKKKVESQRPDQAKYEGISKTGKWKCSDCGLSFAYRHGLNAHMKYTHSDYAYQCFCSKAFSSPSNLRKHMLQFHPELDPSDPSLSERVKKTDLPDAQQNMMQIMSTVSRKRKLFQMQNKVLPSITAFNCHDCKGVFSTITALFEHCRLTHRIAADGTKYRYLVPVPRKT